MNYKQRENAKKRQDAIQFLGRLNVKFYIPTAGQIKIPPNVSFYYSTGRIFVDGDIDGNRYEPGLATLEALLHRLGYLSKPQRRVHSDIDPRAQAFELLKFPDPD